MNAPERIILQVKNLTASAAAPRPRPILHGVDFDLRSTQRLGIVGPSGSGKSMILKALTGFTPAAIEVSGTVSLNGKDVLSLPPAERHRLVTSKLALLWQDSMQSLNPYESIGIQLAKALQLHEKRPRAELRDLAQEWLGRVGLPQGAKVLQA